MQKSLFALLLLFGVCTPAKAEVNVRFDPLSTLIGLYSVDVDIAVSDAWSIGPTVRYINLTDGDFDINAYGLGVRGNYWFNEAVFTQGWYFGPSVQYVSVNVNLKENIGSSELTGDASGIALIGIFGYQWMWEAFNISLGAGPAYYSISKITVRDNQGNSDEYEGTIGAGLSLEFSLGWKF